VVAKVTGAGGVQPKGTNRSVGAVTKATRVTTQINPANWIAINTSSGQASELARPATKTARSYRVNQARALRVNKIRGTQRVTKTKYPTKKMTGKNSRVG
jgi:hypothetical protein